MLAVYFTGRFHHFRYIYSYSVLPVYGSFYFRIRYRYSGLNQPVFVVYKEGNIVDTSSNSTVRLRNQYYSLHFDVYSVTESDIGVYEIRWVSGGLSWFTAIYVQGQNYR